MAKRITAALKRYYNGFIAALNLSILAVLVLVLIAAYQPNDPYLRPSLYLLWRVFFENPLQVLIVFQAVLLLLFVSSLLCGKSTLDSFLSVFALGLTGLFLFMLALHTLNLGLEALLYPLTAHSIPPLNVHNPIMGFLALTLILLKGFLLEQICFGSSSIVEKICLIMGFGFGLTSIQAATLSYLKLLHPVTVIALDLVVFMALLLIYLSNVGFSQAPSLHSLFSVRPNGYFSNLTKFKPFEIAAISATALLLLVDSYYAIAAIVEWDSLSYLAYYAKVIYANHGVLDLYGPSVGLEMSTAYPIGFQALGVYLYEYVGTADDFYMRILPPIFYFALLLATYLLSSQIFESEEESLLCVFTVASSLILNYYVALSSHYMTYLVFLTTMSIYFLVSYLKVHDQKLLLFSGFFGGLASLVNYLGLLTITFLVVGILLRKAEPATLSLKALLINTLIPSIYLLRNLLLKGDPIFPFLTFSSDPLWNFRQQHFYLQSIYAGLQFSSPFSVVDFLIMRCLGTRPWLTVEVLVAPVLIIYAWRNGQLGTLEAEERILIALFMTAVACFLIASTFERYILPMIAIFACFYVWMSRKARDFAMRRSAFALTLIVLYSFSMTFAASLGGYKLFNSEASSGNVADYLAYYYAGDANCWRWINEHTDATDRIASFEIRYYYIEREVFPLDSEEAAPLYDSNLTIGEAIEYLKDRGVHYILSPEWVSLAEILPAYHRLVITPFLGEPKYFPPVYVNGSSAIYHVGSLDVESLVASYMNRSTIPPIPGLSLKLNATSKNGLSVFYLPVPGDYHRRGNLTIQVLSQSLNASIQIWEGIHKDTNRLVRVSKMVAQSQRYGNMNSKLNWLLEGGSYTLVIRVWDVRPNPARVGLSIDISTFVNATRL